MRETMTNIQETMMSDTTDFRSIPIPSNIQAGISNTDLVPILLTTAQNDRLGWGGGAVGVGGFVWGVVCGMELIFARGGGGGWYQSIDILA